MGSHVWTEDSDVAWIDGEVLEVNGDEVNICCADEKVVSAHGLKICLIPHFLVECTELNS